MDMCASSQTRCRQSGFSLSEMMVVIALVGIVAGFAVPAVRDFMSGQRVKSATLDFSAAVMFARSEAMKRGAQIFIKAPSGNDLAGGWCVVFADANAECNLSEPGGAVMRLQQPLPGVAINWSTTAGPIGFNTSGRLSGQVKLKFSEASNGGHLRCLTIDASGSATSKRGDC